MKESRIDMKALLTNEIIKLIKKQITAGTANLVRLENFESPLLYMQICDYFFKYKKIDNFNGIIDIHKFNDFRAVGKYEWKDSLDYLQDNGFVNADFPLTKFRNKAAEYKDKTCLILLMGAETADDKGSIGDFYRISSTDIIAQLKKNYSIWFKSKLIDIDADKSDNWAVLNNIFRSVFKKQNVDIITFSRFIDDINNEVFESFDEIIEYIFNNLKKYWNMPSVIQSIPKTSRMRGNKSVAIIENTYKFITNTLDVSSAKMKKMSKKLSQYAETHDIDINTSFEGFSSYNDFKKALIKFLSGRNIDYYRPKFMNVDFGVINAILDLKTVTDTGTKPPKDKVVTLYGEPLDVFQKMLVCSCIKYRGDKKPYGEMPVHLIVSVKEIKLSNCISDDDSVDDTLEKSYRSICSYTGGLLSFINEKVLTDNNIKVKYENDYDPFDYENFEFMQGRIKRISKWGENSQVLIDVTAVGESENKKKTFEFKWSFSPYASWKNAFILFIDSFENPESDDYEIPYIIQCTNIQDFLSCESEEEFNIKLESMQAEIVDKKFQKELKNYFYGTDIYDKFNLFSSQMTDWFKNVYNHGLFTCISKMEKMIDVYRELLAIISDNYNKLTASKKEKLNLFLNCFTVVSGDSYLKTLKSSEVIIPPYHPAMLEKINARNFYLIYSLGEILKDFDNINITNYKQRLDTISEFATITQGVDIIPDGTGKIMICRSVWGFYATYYNDNTVIEYISNIEHLQDEYDETDATRAINIPQARVIANNVCDFLKTFPACADGLNICIVAPTEIQDIVTGLGRAAEELDKQGYNAVLNVKIICFGGSKNVSGYLRYWLDNYASKEKNITINTYLKYVQESNIVSEMPQLLKNQDICFIYDILRTNNIVFDQYNLDIEEQQEQMTSCQFPMTFIPDTLSSTHSQNRKVNISQIQFLVSDAYTQLANKVINPHSVEAKYKVMQVLSLENSQSSLLNVAHDNCKWVVCIDKAIDRDLLLDNNNRIIGFTTGEGYFGEYNITVSAKEEIIEDIKKLLKIRLVEKFKDWKNDRIEKSADYCIEMTRHFDGSRILKALNPYDYEIHNFLAYVLTVKALGIDIQSDTGYLSRTLLNLDTYRHWFSNAENRPDFMLIELPDTPENRSGAGRLKIKIKIIECKMGIHIANYIEKAKKQVTVGIDTLSNVWSADNTKVNRRYWYTQLYRAIAFSKLRLTDGDADYKNITSKIYGILNGNFDIEWNGDIYAYDLTDDSAISEEEIIEIGGIADIVTLHKAGQLFIQKMLLPDEYKSEEFVFSDIEDEDISTNDEEDEEITEQETILSESNAFETTFEDTNHIINETNSDINQETINKKGTSIDSEIETEVVSSKKSLSEVRILLGEDERSKHKYYWEFGNKMLNNRHLLINGNSGYGKTYCIQALLMELSLQGIPSVIFDYTGGFAPNKLENVFTSVLGDRIEQRVIKIKKIPINPFARGKIYLMEDMVIDEENTDIANKIANVLTAAYKFGEQQKATVYSAIMEGLSKYDENMSFAHLYETLSKVGNQYSESVMNKMRPFIDLNLFSAADEFRWEDIRNSEGMVYIIQMIGYNRPTQLMLTELLLWDLWNYAQSNGKESEPLVVVLDEAQNLNHKSTSPSGKILTEGRKFGISGWYATQFMKGQLSEDEIQCLQQASQKLYFCPPENGVIDVAKSIDISSGHKKWAEKLKKLKKGECVTCGSMVINGKWTKYEPKIIKVASFQERLDNE